MASAASILSAPKKVLWAVITTKNTLLLVQPWSPLQQSNFLSKISMCFTNAKIRLSKLTGWESKNIEVFNRWQEVICKCQTIPKMLVIHGTSAIDAISMYFPAACVNDDTFPRSCGGLVRSWTNLVSPRLNLESLVLSSPIYYVTKGHPHPCNSGSARSKLESSCSGTPIISLINEQVRSAHCVPLKPDYIYQTLKFKGHVLSLSRTRSCWRTSHCTYTPILLHLTPHICRRTTHFIVSPRPHSRSCKADKRARETSQQVPTWYGSTLGESLAWISKCLCRNPGVSIYLLKMMYN